MSPRHLSGSPFNTKELISKIFMRLIFFVMNLMFVSLNILGASALTAQELHTSGWVTDKGNTNIRGAVILAENPNASPPTFSTTTDNKGVYSLAGIKPGTWKLTVSMPGFVTQTSDIVVEVNRTGFIGGLIPREDGAHGTTEQALPRIT